MIRKAIAVVLLGTFGLLKLPAERSLDARQRQAGLRSTALDLDLREMVGQMGFLAAKIVVLYFGFEVLVGELRGRLTWLLGLTIAGLTIVGIRGLF